MCRNDAKFSMPSRIGTSLRGGATVLLLIGVFGCADATRIRTDPGGARVFINDQLACITPALGGFCVYRAPRSQFSRHTPIRIEHDGYRTIESELRTATLPSRIVGGIFTLGIVPIFKRPHTYVSLHEYVMQPIAVSERNIPTKPEALQAPADVRFRDAQQLHEKGLISDEEYERIRRTILNDL